MKEKTIESKLKNTVKSMGGIALKLISPGFDGMPDRLVLLPHGKLAFIELKAPGKRPRPLQIKRHEMLRRLGFQAFVLEDMAQIQQILKEIKDDVK